MRTIAVILISFISVCVGCKKNNVFAKKKYEGMYIGVTHYLSQEIGPNGLESLDTIYIDTFEVKLIGKDSISFHNIKASGNFLRNSDDYYNWSSRYIDIKHWLYPADSLIVDYYSGSPGASYEKFYFKGIKF